MKTVTITIDKIRTKLWEVPQERLTEVYDFVEFIVQKSKPKKKNIVKLEGIWKGLGFEKIDNLETEIRKIRDNSHRRMVEKVQKWNTIQSG